MSASDTRPNPAPDAPAIPNFREDERVVARYAAMIQRRIKDFASEHDGSVRRNAAAKRDELRDELDAANEEWTKRNEAYEAAREAYRKQYPDRVKKTRLVEPTALENMKSLGAAGKLYKAAQEAWHAAETAASNVRRLEHNEAQLEVELQKAIEREPEVVKEVTTSAKWLNEIHQDEELAAVRDRCREIEAERAAYAERLAAGKVGHEELRLRSFAEGDVKPFAMPASALVFSRVDVFGPDAYAIMRDARKNLFALPYDRRFETIIDGIFDFVRTGKEFELRRALQPNGPLPMTLVDYWKRSTDNDEWAQEEMRRHQEFVREKRMLATTAPNEFDEIETTAVELLLKYAAEKTL